MSQVRELEDQVRRAQSRGDLRLVMTSFLDELAFEHMVYHPLPLGPSIDEGSTQMLTYPQEWIERYLAEQYFAIDPVVLSVRQGVTHFEWSLAECPPGETQRFLLDAERHGIGRRGLSLSVYDSRGRAAIFSVTSNSSDREWGKLPWSQFRTVSQIAAAVHEKVLELEGGSTPKLSNGELTCLSLLLQGSTPKHAAGTLGVSENRVRAILQKACAKLKCKTTTQAVAVAYEKRLIP